MNLLPAPLRNLKDSLSGLGKSNSLRRQCTRCRGVRFERVPRIGIMAEKILPFFSLYPWRCVLCSRVIYRTLRINEQDPGNRA